MRSKSAFVFIVSSFVLCSVGLADIKLPSLISDGMVLQQNSNVNIWGWAEAGEKIEVRPVWQKNSVKAVADKDGKWKVEIKTPEAGGPFAIAFKGKNEVIVKDVWIGEVWVCSGQSNMRFEVENCDNAEEEIAAANWPEIKLFVTVHRFYGISFGYVASV